MALDFQGRPGDETATAFCVPILERVLERYPTSLAPKDAGMLTRAPTSEATTPHAPPDVEAYELVALVLTRTREMATDIFVSQSSKCLTSYLNRGIQRCLQRFFFLFIAPLQQHSCPPQLLFHPRHSRALAIVHVNVS